MSDANAGFHSEIKGTKTGRAVADRLDEFSDSGYKLSVYDSEGEGFEVTAGVSEDFLLKSTTNMKA